jgi:NADH-quinone oxidoreductase subunit J
MIEAVFFYILAALLLGLGLTVIMQTNPLASAMAMVGAFAALAAIYALLSAPFVAVLQVLVYAGGIMVLMISVIMLLNLRDESLQVFRVRPATLALWLTASGMGLTVPLWVRFVSLGKSPVALTDSGFGSLNHIAAILFGPFLFPFEMLSLVLLGSLVGAVVLAKKRL